MIIGFVIWTVVAVAFLMIGISCRKSQEAVGFFTFAKPPIVENIKVYNNKVSLIWFIFAISLEVIGISFLFFEQNSPVFILIMILVPILVITMMIAYLKIELKYRV